MLSQTFAFAGLPANRSVVAVASIATPSGFPSIVTKSSRQSDANVDGNDAAMIPVPVTSAIAVGSPTGSEYRRSMVTASLVAVMVIDSEVPVSAGNEMVLLPLASGGSTATVSDPDSLLTVTSVMIAYWDDAGWLICSDDTVLRRPAGS